MADFLYPLLTAAVGLVTVLVTVKVSKRKVIAETHQAESSAAAVLTETALRLVTELKIQVDELTAEVARQASEIVSLRIQIEAANKAEVFLEAKVHEREQRIAHLEQENEELKRRVEHLEQVCRRAGINGADLDNPSDV